MTEQEHKELVAELRVAIERSPPGERRERLLERLHQLEHSHGTESLGEHVKALIEEAVHVAPLEPAALNGNRSRRSAGRG
jgi:hypothetical protein